MSAAHKITARGYQITARSNISAGWVWAIQGATSAVGRGGRAAGGHRMIPKDCKRLAEVTFPMPRSTSTRRGRSTVEVWGRGTNRVIEMCGKHGAPPPVFEEMQRLLVVTFRAPLVAGGAAGTSRSESGDQVTAEVTAQVAALCPEPQPARAIMAELGLKHWKTFQTNYLAPLMTMGILERTIPDKPRSRMQRYRATEAGLVTLRKVECEG